MDLLKNKHDLLETMKDLRVLEITARDSYEQDTHIFKNPKIIKTFKTIKKEEDKHIAILDTIIVILEDLE